MYAVQLQVAGAVIWDPSITSTAVAFVLIVGVVCAWWMSRFVCLSARESVQCTNCLFLVIRDVSVCVACAKRNDTSLNYELLWRIFWISADAALVLINICAYMRCRKMQQLLWIGSVCRAKFHSVCLYFTLTRDQPYMRCVVCSLRCLVFAFNCVDSSFLVHRRHTNEQNFYL